MTSVLRLVGSLPVGMDAFTTFCGVRASICWGAAGRVEIEIEDVAAAYRVESWDSPRERLSLVAFDGEDAGLAQLAAMLNDLFPN